MSLYFVLSSAVFYLVALILWSCTFWWDKRLRVLHAFTCFWAYMYIWIMPAWSVTITGREKLMDQPMVMVSNHQSLLDILVAFGLFFPFKWVSKVENFKLPFIGWNMRLNRYIAIVRGDKDSAHRMLDDCEQALKQGSAVYIFPEGTRSETGIVKAFKPGAFILAHQLKLPIQPLVINGAKDALPKHSLEIQGFHAISLEVLEPIAYNDFAELSIEETAANVRAVICAHVIEHQQAEQSAQEVQEQAT